MTHYIEKTKVCDTKSVNILLSCTINLLVEVLRISSTYLTFSALHTSNKHDG